MTAGGSFSGIRNIIRRLTRAALGYHISIYSIKRKSVEKKRKRLVSVPFNI